MWDAGNAVVFGQRGAGQAGYVAGGTALLREVVGETVVADTCPCRQVCIRIATRALGVRLPRALSARFMANQRTVDERIAIIALATSPDALSVPKAAIKARAVSA